MEKEKFLTVKELSEKVGITTQAIYKRLQTDFKPYLQVINSKKCLSIEVLELFEEQEIATRCQPVANELQPFLQRVVNQLQTQNEQMQGQLAVKDKQIENLILELAKEREHNRAQSETIAVLADQSQKLQLAQMKSQLTDGEHLTREEPQDVSVPATAPEQTPTKKSWKWWK